MKQNRLELGQFIDWNLGQNYPFGACMAKLVECLGGEQGKQNDAYEFFSCLAGDNFVMCYGNNDKFNDCVSVCTDVEPFMRRVCGILGMEYLLVRKAEWSADVGRYYAMVKDFIDRGIPVLVKGSGNNKNYNLLTSYDDETGLTHISCGDDVNYGSDEMFGEMEYDLIFINRMPQIPDIAAVYREAVMQIPKLMSAQQTEDGVVFGAEAYRRWIEDTRGGRYDAYTEDTFDAWKHWHIYICNLSTNASFGETFLKDAQKYNPDLTFIPELISLRQKNDEVWSELEANGGGFNATLENLQDKEKREKIVKALEKLLVTNKKIIEIIR